MSNASEHEVEDLSALADGELDPLAVARACASWRAGTSSHTTWHAYHLIGDVLRSDDLASLPLHDYACLDKLRERLAAEPRALAPGPARRWFAADRSMRKPGSWAARSAVAAGCAALAGVWFVLRGPADDAPVRALNIARADAPAGATPAAPGKVHGASRPFEHAPAALFADGKLVRDARLDRYLDAHKHFSGVSALGVPSTFLRGATSDASNR